MEFSSSISQLFISIHLIESKHCTPIIKCTRFRREKNQQYTIQLEWHLLSSEGLIWTSVNVICWFTIFTSYILCRLKWHFYVLPFYDNGNWKLISPMSGVFHRHSIKFRTFNHNLSLALKMTDETFNMLAGQILENICKCVNVGVRTCDFSPDKYQRFLFSFKFGSHFILSA